MGRWSKKIKEHENGTAHKKMLQQLDVAQRRDSISLNGGKTRNENFSFKKNVLERLIEIVIFLAERNLAFRGSDEVLGSPHNENFLGLFELLANRDPVLMELKNRIIKHTTKSAI